ncbi:UbiD family decarboxylase [Chloroflexota bacterium]
MAYYKDLREYLKALEDNGKLVHIKGEINKDTQLYPLIRLQYRGLPEEERRAFLFENVIDSKGRKYDIPVVVGALASSSQMYAIGMKCKAEEISERLAQAEMNLIAPKLVDNGPVQEVVRLGDNLLEHGGLGEFPIPIATPGFDPSPYITAPYWVTKDPDTGIPNVGMYRAMVKSPTRTGLNFGVPTRHGFIHFRRCKERGIPLQAAIVIGGPPNLGYVAVSPLPTDINEFAVAGAIAGEPVELVKCKTVDLEVPANAEIVIEGEVPTNELEPEAPFGEAYGFVGLEDMNPFFNIKCITHRRKPIWMATLSQYPPSESSKIRQFAQEGTIFRHLRHDLKMSHVLQVGFLDTTGSNKLMAIKVDKTTPAEVMRTLEAAAQRMPVTKIIVAVDKDVNIHDLDSLTLAILKRSQPHRDYRIDTLPAPSLADYSIEPEDKLEKRLPTDPDRPMASRLLINATMQWPYPPLSLPKEEFMEEALRLWQREGLPKLTLKEPWWGISLGFWSKEHEEYAQAVVKGDYYRAGDAYSKRRAPG